MNGLRQRQMLPGRNAVVTPGFPRCSGVNAWSATGRLTGSLATYRAGQPFSRSRSPGTCPNGWACLRSLHTDGVVLACHCHADLPVAEKASRRVQATNNVELYWPRDR